MRRIIAAAADGSSFRAEVCRILHFFFVCVCVTVLDPQASESELTACGPGAWVELYFAHGGKGSHACIMGVVVVVVEQYSFYIPVAADEPLVAMRSSPGWAPLAEFVADSRHGWHGDAREHHGGTEVGN